MPETITYDETGDVLALAAARDQRTVGDADVLAWHADLNAAGITFADAQEALTRFYLEMARREPRDRFRATSVDIVDLALKTRRTRLANFRYEPPPGGRDPDYLTRLRSQISATADGHPPARLQLPRRYRPELEAVDEVVVRDSPADDEQPRTSQRETGPYTAACPTCQAPIGRHCHQPGDVNRPRRKPHGARRRVARGEPATPQTGEEHARREAAAQRLARLTPEERQQLDQFQKKLADGTAS